MVGRTVGLPKFWLMFPLPPKSSMKLAKPEEAGADRLGRRRHIGIADRAVEVERDLIANTDVCKIKAKLEEMFTLRPA